MQNEKLIGQRGEIPKLVSESRKRTLLVRRNDPGGGINHLFYQPSCFQGGVLHVSATITFQMHVRTVVSLHAVQRTVMPTGYITYLASYLAS